MTLTKEELKELASLLNSPPDISSGGESGWALEVLTRIFREKGADLPSEEVLKDVVKVMTHVCYFCMKNFVPCQCEDDS
jgi:hypothetical protein